MGEWRQLERGLRDRGKRVDVRGTGRRGFGEEERRIIVEQGEGGLRANGS